MLKVDFFDQKYVTEPVRNDALCGIVDPEGASPAYCTTDSSELWVAIVKNERGKVFRFTPLDNNLPLLREDGSQESLCDGMIVYVDPDGKRNLAFVELKEKRKSKDSDATGQLKSTILAFLKNHDYKAFYRRFAKISVAHLRCYLD